MHTTMIFIWLTACSIPLHWTCIYSRDHTWKHYDRYTRLAYACFGLQIFVKTYSQDSVGSPRRERKMSQKRERAGRWCLPCSNQIHNATTCSGGVHEQLGVWVDVRHHSWPVYITRQEKVNCWFFYPTASIYNYSHTITERGWWDFLKVLSPHRGPNQVFRCLITSSNSFSLCAMSFLAWCLAKLAGSSSYICFAAELSSWNDALRLHSHIRRNQ